MTPAVFATLWLSGLTGLCVLYVVPSFVAFRRQHPNRWAIMAVNVFLGTTASAGRGLWSGRCSRCTARVTLAAHTGVPGLNVFADDVRRVHLVEGQRALRGGSGSPLTTVAAVTEIERLTRLHAAGHLDAAEYATLKSQVLERL